MSTAEENNHCLKSTSNENDNDQSQLTITLSRSRSRSRSFDGFTNLRKTLSKSSSRQNVFHKESPDNTVNKSKNRINRGGDLTCGNKQNEAKNGTDQQVRATIFSHRYYQTICILCVTVFLCIHGALKLNHSFSLLPLCDAPHENAQWMKNLNIFSAGGMVFTFFSHLNRMCLSTFRENGDIGTKGSYVASVCISGMATVASVSLLDDNWGGYCIDAFG